MRPIGRSRNVVRMLAATLVPEHCSSGHRGKLCRWSHLISSAEGQRNCWPTLKLCRAIQLVKYQSSPLRHPPHPTDIVQPNFRTDAVRLALPDFFLLMCAQGGHVRRTRLMIGSDLDTYRRRDKTGPSILQYTHRYSATFGKSFTRTNPSWLVNVSVWSALCAWATPKMRWLPVS
jgi:hypothetical protein